MLKVYRGKVRDTYTSDGQIMLVATNRISAFDQILPKEIPYKGAVLNQISAFFLEKTKDLAPNWLKEIPNPYVSIGIACHTIPIEVIIRGYITGSMWRAYEQGERIFCGVALSEGLQNYQKLPTPIITPTTKALEGHDENSSKVEILKQNIVSEEEWQKIEDYALKIFKFGSEFASTKNLILVDTKLEFGKTKDGELIVIDEILTPDSSRYFILDTYESNIKNLCPPEQLSKEFVRQWLIEEGFMGLEGQKMPEMSEEWVEEISQKYIELYEKIIGKPFDKELNKWKRKKINDLINDIFGGSKIIKLEN